MEINQLVSAEKLRHQFDPLPSIRTIREWQARRAIPYFKIGRRIFFDPESVREYINRRGILSTFFRFAMHRGWIADNPVAKIPQHRIRRRRGMAATLAAAQVRDLLRFLEDYQGGKFVPYYVLCLFAGIRPGVPHGEIKKLKPDAVNLDTGVIHISSEVSKTREPRRITIQPNLLAWLRAYPLEKYPIVVGNFQKKRAKFSKQFNLSHDVLRHTFISMFVAKFRSIGEAAIQAGNSESIIRRHYLDLKTTAEAEEFWSILPRHQAVAVNSPGAAPLPTEAPAPYDTGCCQSDDRHHSQTLTQPDGTTDGFPLSWLYRWQCAGRPSRRFRWRRFPEPPSGGIAGALGEVKCRAGDPLWANKDRSVTTQSSATADVCWRKAGEPVPD